MDVKLYQGDCIEILKEIELNSVHAVVSDIPYGINYDDWDILHNNKNSALGGSTEHQKSLGSLFKRRGKPINGWSLEDKQIPKEYQEWCSRWGFMLYDILKPGGSVLLFTGRRYMHRCIVALEDVGFNLRDIIAWDKVVAPFRAQRVSCVFERRGDIENSEKYSDLRLGNLAPVFEPIVWLQKPYKQGDTLTDNLLNNGVGCFNSSVFQNNLITFRNQILKEDKVHPTQKSVDLMCKLIELVTLEGQTVLDPFMGSGSTGVACKRVNRNFIGIELNEEYYKISKKRINISG